MNQFLRRVHGAGLFFCICPMSFCAQPRQNSSLEQKKDASPKNSLKAQKSPSAQQNPPASTADSVETLSLLNASNFTINVRFETETNPAVIQPIPPTTMQQITRKKNSVMVYSFEGGSTTTTITPDMVQGGVVTIRQPAAVPVRTESATTPSPVAAPTSTSEATLVPLKHREKPRTY